MQSSLFRGGALSLLIQAQFTAVQLFTGIILARMFGPAKFGIYSFGLAILNLIQVMPNSGLDNVVVRYSAQYRAQQSWALLRGLWRMALIASAAYGVLTATAMGGLFSLGWLPTTAAVSPAVLVAAAAPMLFLPLMTFLGAALRGVTPGVMGQLPRYAVRPWVYLALLFAFIAAAPRALSPEMAMWALGAAAFATTLVGAIWLLKFQPAQLRTAPATYESRHWLSSVPAFFLLGGLMLINTQADLLLLGILGSAHETGLYKVAASGANLVVLSLAAANLYIAPRISAMYTRGEQAKLQRLLSLSVRSTFVVALLIACVFWFWGRDVLKLVFGAAYVGAFWPLTILCLGQLINVGTGSVALVLSMTGHERDAARMAAVAAVVNLALNVLLIPILGAVGAATATLITMIIWNGLMLTSVRRRTGLHVSIFGAIAVSQT